MYSNDGNFVHIIMKVFFTPKCGMLERTHKPEDTKLWDADDYYMCNATFPFNPNYNTVTYFLEINNWYSMCKTALSFFFFCGGKEGREESKDCNSFPLAPLTAFYKQFQINQTETKQSKEAICN